MSVLSRNFVHGQFVDCALWLSSKQMQIVVMDAKYRSSRSAVLDVMASAHLYRDSLRWRGRRPDCALLIISRGGAVLLLESQQYRQDNSVGVVTLGDADLAANAVAF